MTFLCMSFGPAVTWYEKQTLRHPPPPTFYFLSVYVACACMCTWILVCKYMHSIIHVWRSRNNLWYWSLHSKGPSIVFSTAYTRLAGHELLRIFFSVHFSSPCKRNEVTNVYTTAFHFYMDLGESNSGPHRFAANAFTAIDLAQTRLCITWVFKCWDNLQNWKSVVLIVFQSF